MKFAITGQFRTRSKWASVFLSTPECPVIHDAMPEQFKDAQAISTPLVMKSWSYIPEDTKIILINRPLPDVIEAMKPYDVTEQNIRKLETYKEDMLRNRDVLILDYYSLDAKKLYEYCHGVTVSDEYIKVFYDMNITQQSMFNLLRVA